MVTGDNALTALAVRIYLLTPNPNVQPRPWLQHSDRPYQYLPL